MNDEELTELFIKRIRQRLNTNHMKRIDISRKTGIPKNTISQYMTGRRKPTYDKVIRIAQALECEPGDLINIDEPLE